MPDSQSNAMKFFAAGMLVLLIAACGENNEPRVESIRHLPPIAAPGSGEPHLARTADGQPLLSWLEPADQGVALKYALFDSGAWGAAQTVAEGDNWFVNWADIPSVVPITDDFWAAHWLRKTPGNAYSYDIVVSLSNDGGKHWNEPFVPHDDGTSSEHGFVTMLPWQDELLSVWLDGRETPSGGPMTLRSGQFNSDGSGRNEVVLDNRICDCCQTDVAVARSGPIAVYRDRDEEEIRDIFVTRLIDGRWTTGTAVANDGWHITGCPVNGPAVAAIDDRVVVGWFTAANDEPRVRVAFSADGGEHFSPAIDIDDARPIGRVAIAMTEDGETVLAWLADVGGGNAAVNAVMIGADGLPRPPQQVAVTSTGRLSGFPQILLQDDSVLIAWTDRNEAGTSVHTASLPMSLL